MFPAILALVALASTAPDSLTGPGVSLALAKARAAQISNVRYGLQLDVTRRDTLVGHAKIQFARKGTGDVILDFRGFGFQRVVANGSALAARAVNGHIILPAASMKKGENVVELDFQSAIAPAGASVIRFHDITDGADYLYTLLVPADANQLFPCFDQPDLKARVTLELVTQKGWTAVANAKLARVDTAANLTFRFRQSDRISTYLIAFAAGPWTVKSAAIGRRTISMYVRASRAKEAETDTLIALNARAIAWLERYTRIPFPFQKYDFVLAPAFPFGGMEHPGAVFYNEESFIYRERPTLSQLLGREATIYHEVVHQWFGDLTTMRWFDDLWLKEGFATYIGALMQADLDPSSNAWKTFYLRNKPAAYGVDAGEGTTPVWQSLANLDQAKSNYGAIVYNKAPGILKQLHYLVGDTAFRNGLGKYLSRHEYTNTTWSDLLTSVGRASNQSLESWGANYIRRPGMPVLTPTLVSRGGRVVTLAIDQAAAKKLSGTDPWPIRIEVLLGYANAPAVTIPVVLKGARTEISLAGHPQPDFVYLNARDFGYALVRLDERSRTWLLDHVGEVRDDFLRAMLWGTLWDEVRDARLAPSRFVSAALREIPRESDEQLVPVILGRISRSVTAYLSAADRDAILPEVERALRAMANDSTRTYGVRKNNLDTYIGIARTPAAMQHIDALLDSTTAAGAPLRAPTRWAIVTSLVARASATADARLAAEAHRDSTTEGKRRAFVAGAGRPDSATKAAYWNRYFADRALNEDWVTASLRGFHDPARDDLSRRYVVPALDSLPWVQKNRRIFFLGNWVGATLDGQRSPEALAEVDRFLRDRTLPRDLREKILQSRDELERTVAIRRAFR